MDASSAARRPKYVDPEELTDTRAACSLPADAGFGEVEIRVASLHSEAVMSVAEERMSYSVARPS